MGSTESRTTSLQVGGVDDLWLHGAAARTRSSTCCTTVTTFTTSLQAMLMSNISSACSAYVCVRWDAPWLVQQHMGGDVHAHTTHTSCIELHISVISHPHCAGAAEHSASYVALILDIHLAYIALLSFTTACAAKEMNACLQACWRAGVKREVHK
jgi:hypothetical protein